MRHARFQISGLVFELQTGRQAKDFVIPPSYEPFLVAEGQADLFLKAEYADIPPRTGDLVFDSGGPWQLWKDDAGFRVSVHSAGDAGDPYQVAMVDEGFSRGETIIRPDILESSPDYFPFNYPIDEVLAINRISKGHGLEVHACGLSDNGRGILFLGVSGSGKSTMSRIWDEEGGVLVLSDDRIIITRRDGEFWIHGTPWHGDAGIADPAGVRLEAIFFISHADGNSHVRLNPAISASQVIARSFPTFWNREGMEFSVSLAGQLAEHIPAYEMGFTPDGAIVEYVRRIL